MPRMTRAALRAQQVEEEQEPQHDNLPLENELECYSQRQTRSAAQIHEDSSDTEAARESETKEINNSTTSEKPTVRLALRDITDENYPIADLAQFGQKIELYTQIHTSQEIREELQPERAEPPKSTKKGRAKAKGKTKKKAETAVVIEPESEHPEELSCTGNTQIGAESHRFVEEPLVETVSSNKEIQQQPVSQQPLYTPDVSSTPIEEESGPGPAIEEFEDQSNTHSLVSKTPKFDPSVHLSDHEATTTEDSFVHSIRSRSPSKFSQSPTQYTQPSPPFNSSLQAYTPLRRTSSSKFEESFEAMDSLEDNIEQLTAGLPMLARDDIDSPESPLKLDRKSLMVQTRSTTPKIVTTRTPKSSAKLQSVLTGEEKNCTPSKARTPFTRHAASLKNKTPLAREASPAKPQTPAVRGLSPSKRATASVRKSTVKSSTTKHIDSPSTANHKHDVVIHQPTLPFSNSPAKERPNIHKKRSTSSVLSTAKPGFIPAKSSKPPTIATFALPGEAIAEKLKAQREAREEKMKEPKMSLAEQKAAKLKADREAREERVRQNQEKAREVSNTQKPRPGMKHTRPLSVHVQPSIPPRENKASQARMSRVFSGSDKENVAPQTTAAVAPTSSRTTLTVSKTRTDSSTTSLKPNTSAHRKSVIIQSPRKDSTAVSTKPRPSSAIVTSAQHARIMSISNGQRLNVTKEDAAQQKVRGKEVFQRARQNLHQEQKEKREKEEAAKKARADAAAAGRMASREWAERMMKKKQSQQEAKSESDIDVRSSEAVVGTA